MAKSFARPAPDNTVEDYAKNNKFFHAPSNTYFETIRRDGNYYQRRYQVGYEGKPTNIDETKIDYMPGSAFHARAYLHRTTDGRLVQLPAAATRLIWRSSFRASAALRTFRSATSLASVSLHRPRLAHRVLQLVAHITF